MGNLNAALMTQGAKTKLGHNASKHNARYVEKACKAISGAVGTWQPLAMFAGLKINSVTAIGTPGCLRGPSLEPFIISACPLGTDWERKMSKAVAAGVSEAWEGYIHSVTVPGMPWYPSFAAVPAPMAPPTPNVPSPLITLPQQSAKRVQSAAEDAITRKAKSLSGAELIAKAIAAGLGMALPIWVGSVVIRNVLGKGPVPAFAPPYVPVGPVVMGDNLPVPGHLAA